MDVVRASVSAGHVVIWEESARDGAQGKTLLTGPQRVALARSTGSLFGDHGPEHVIFAAGFPAICAQEFEIMRQLAAEVDNCTLASHGRATRTDIDLGIAALAGAAHSRVTFWIPASVDIAEVLGMGTPEVALRRGLEMLEYALSRSGGAAVDVALVGCSRAEPQLVADMAMTLGAAGAGIVKVCDSVGEFHPRAARKFFGAFFDRIDRGADLVVGAHLHNDLGFALANNLEALDAGARVLASSWLGLGERNGLAATEQLLFALTHDPIVRAYGAGGEEEAPGQPREPRGIWSSPPDLTGLVPIAQQVSAATGVPIKVTDAIVGTGVNTISTGTPFLSRTVFQPFDAEGLLGTLPEIVLTQLASKRVIDAVAAEAGLELTAEQSEVAMKWVKDRAYRCGNAVVSKADFYSFLNESLACDTDSTLSAVSLTR